MRSEVSYNKAVAPGYYLMGLSLDTKINLKPGQFVSLGIDELPLRRPFTVYRLADCLEILYKVTGRGTEMMSMMKPHEVVDILGPLGNGFPMIDSGRAVLLGRGAGLASLACLGEALSKKGAEVITVGSFKDRQSDLTDKYISSFSKKVIRLYDEDKSSNPENVRKILNSLSPDAVYTCGSKRLVRMLGELPYKAYASLEERMGCGLGSCLTCVVLTPSGYKRVCKDGPCFDVKEVIV